MGTVPLIESEIREQIHTRLDPVAILSAALTLLACCPAAAVFGVATGLLSQRRIQRSAGSLTGRRLAITCTIASALIGVAAWIVGGRVERASTASINSEVRVAVDQLLIGEVEPSAWWSGVDPNELLVFSRKIRQQLGPTKITSISKSEMEIALKSTARFRLLLESQATPSVVSVASITVDFVTDFKTFLPSVRIQSIEISLPKSDRQADQTPALIFPAP